MCIEEYTKEHADYVRKIEDDRKNEKISQLEKDKDQLEKDKNKLEKDNTQLKEESERKDKIIAEKDRQLETVVNGLIRLVKDGKFSVDEAAKYSGISTEEFEKMMNSEK